MEKIILYVAACLAMLSHAAPTAAQEADFDAEMRRCGLVDIRELAPDIRVELKYATTDNFVGQNMYGTLRTAYLVPSFAAKVVKALRLLRPGHEMIYSTCSILAQENEALLRRVLPGAQGEIVPIDPAAFPGVPLLPVALPGTLCVMPDACYEGFFAARIRKKGK